MASIGNIFSQMNRGTYLSVTTVVPAVVHNTNYGATYAVGALAALTTWIPDFFPGIKFAPGCVYVNLLGSALVTATKTNTGSTLSPVWAAIS